MGRNEGANLNSSLFVGAGIARRAATVLDFTYDHPPTSARGRGKRFRTEVDAGRHATIEQAILEKISHSDDPDLLPDRHGCGRAAWRSGRRLAGSQRRS